MKKERIYLAGGCFWGTEHYMKTVPGVLETKAGYAVGIDGESVVVDPQYVTYKNVCSGNGHAETVEVWYDADVISLRGILDEFAYTIDPTVLNRQGPDIGVQYRTGIYWGPDCADEAAETVSEFLRDLRNEYTLPIVTEAYKLLQFVDAEEYHQDYLDKNPHGYCHISFADIARRKAAKAVK